MTKRAPSGSAKAARQVGRLVAKLGAPEAARRMGVSERRVKSISNAVEKGKPLGRVIPTTTSLDNLTQSTRAARASVRAENTVTKLRAEGKSQSDIITAREGKENEIAAVIRRAEKGNATPEDARLLTSLRRKELPPVAEKKEKKEKTPPTNAEVAAKDGFAYYDSPKECRKEHRSAIPASRAFGNLEDAINKLKAVPRMYFAIVRVKREGSEKFDFVLYDIRTAAQRRKHAKSKHGGKARKK